MNKILLILCTSFYLLTLNAHAETINNITITGNKRISNDSIKVLAGISDKSEIEKNELNNLLKKLYDTNFFKDIKISLNNGQLKIDVIENPIIENIEVSGIKNKDFIDEILNIITLKDRMSFSELLLEKDIDTINNILKTNGFYFAKVNTSLIKNDELNSVRLRIEIDQGKKARIQEIQFIGDKKIKDKRLLEVIASEEHKFWKFISRKVYLNQSLINLDKRLLANYYKNQGYYKVKVLNSFAELNNEDSFKLTYNIEAGEKYSFNNFKLSLPDDYKISDFKKIEKIFKKLKGKNYTLDNVNLILSEIDRIASMRLYDFITANVTETITGKNKINFDFKILDSQKFYVERINVIGNFQTIEEVIRNKFIVDEGDPLNELLFNKSIDRVRSLGIFKKVETKVYDGSNENLKVVDIIVEEQPTGEISLAAGVGTSGSTLGGGITEKNFLGKGINLTTNLEVSENKVKGKFVYSKPNFNYTDNTLSTSIRSTTTDNLSDFGYETSDFGAAIGTKFEQYENLFFSPEIDLSIEELKTDSTASANYKKQAGNYEDLYFNYGLDYDLRNSSYKPSSGSKSYFYQTLPLVSSNNEIKNTLVLTKYQKLDRATDMVGKISLYLSSVNSVDGSDVRISKRNYVPYNRLRGFEAGKIGPKDGDDYVGGNYISALNLSTNLPSILSTMENLDFSYFIDVANVWGVDYDSSVDQSNFFRSSTGVGMDWLTPVGPLSFSLTQPISKKSTDKTETFRFNLGTTF
ncbi:MAG: outer membrane protein assembly factor BamA [Candidatus Pelagibacter sp.]